MFIWESFASKWKVALRRICELRALVHTHMHTHTITCPKPHRTKLLSCPQITFLKPCLLVLGSS